MRIAVIGYGGIGKAFINLISNKKAKLFNEGYNFQINYILNSSGGIYDPHGINCEDVVIFSNNNENVGKVEKINDELIMTVKLQKLDFNHPFYMVDGKKKAVRFTSDTLGDLTIFGGASGVIPAAASIVRDLINILRGYKFSK